MINSLQQFLEFFYGHVLAQPIAIVRDESEKRFFNNDGKTFEPVGNLLVKENGDWSRRKMPQRVGIECPENGRKVINLKDN